MQKEPLLVPKRDSVTQQRKARKIAEFVAKLRNFVVGLAEKPRQDLATVAGLRKVRMPGRAQRSRVGSCYLFKSSCFRNCR
jgi:hypothetical protein